MDPFAHLDAPIWSEQPPAELHKLAYRYCEELTMREAGNFYHSFKYLPEEQRLAMCAIYAFCRRADDIADGDWADRFPGGKGMLDPEAMEYRNQLESLQDQGTILDEDAYLNKITQLFFFRKKLSTCYGDVHSTDPVFLALKDTVQRYNIPRDVFDDLISGMEDDLYNNRYRTFDELYVYCYRVASVVGLMCIEVYGYDNPMARKYAESWGIFMQLTNVLRDVGEDIQRDRVYLPLDELERNGMTEEELGGTIVLNKHWEPYCRQYAARARTYLEEARALLPLLPRRTRYSPAAMIAFYDKILRQIEKQQGDVFTKRVKLNKIQKISLAAAVYLRHRFLPAFLDPVWAGLARVVCCPAFDSLRPGTLIVPRVPRSNPRLHERFNGKPHAFKHVLRMNGPFFPDTGTKQRHGAGTSRLHRSLLKVEKAVVHADHIGHDLRTTPRTKPMAVSNGRPCDHEGRAGFADPAEQTGSQSNVVASEVKEHEVATVVDFRVDIKVGQSRTKRPDVGSGGVEDLTLSNGVFQKQHGQPEVGVHRASCLAREGLNTGDVSAQNQVVNVVGSFVSFH